MPKIAASVQRASMPVKQPHLKIEPREPGHIQGRKQGGYGGLLIMAAVGGLFLAYIFNFQGFESSVDGFLHGMDGDARSHTSTVAKLVLDALPYAGGLVGVCVLWIVGNLFRGMFRGGAGPKKAIPALPAENPLLKAQPVTAKPKPATATGAVCVKPMRLDRHDPGIAKVILPRR